MIGMGDNGPVTTQPEVVTTQRATQPVQEVDEHEHAVHETKEPGTHFRPFSPSAYALYGTGLMVIGTIIVACIAHRRSHPRPPAQGDSP